MTAPMMTAPSNAPIPNAPMMLAPPTGPDVGDIAPDFVLPSTHGDVHLYDRLNEGPVILVFYPKDDTLVCTRQLCNYRDHLSQFEELGVQVIAVNDEDLITHKMFDQKYRFTFPLAADVGRRVCDTYQCLQGRFKPRREIVVIGDDGRVWWRHRELRVFRRPAAQLLEVVAELQAQR